MPRPFRLTFLWRFTIVLVVVAFVSAGILAYALEDEHNRATELNAEVTALGQVSAALTKPLDALPADGRLDAKSRAALARVVASASFAQYVGGVRIYRPNGRALYPENAPSAADGAHRALVADSFARIRSGDVVTTYAPFYTTAERSFVIAVDVSIAQLASGFARERRVVYEIVGGVMSIVFLSLVALAGGASRELERHRRNAQTSFVQTLSVLAETIDLRDPYTAGHSRRVGAYSRKLALALRLPARQVDTIENAALLHDIGKISVPDAVLFKPGRLDEAEFAIIARHPVVGAELLAGTPAMEEIVPCVMHHHERINGTGYPAKLCGHDIPLGARVISVADSFDAMTTDRPYRRALSIDDAVVELRRVAGTQLDAGFVDAFVRLIEDGEIVPPAPSDAVSIAFGRKGELVAV